MELICELSSELELSKEELDFIIGDNFDIYSDKIKGLNGFYYCYKIIKKYYNDIGGSHQNLFSAVYTAASNISSNIFFAEFASEIDSNLENHKFILEMKCKSLKEIICYSITTASEKVDKHKVYELIRRN